MTRSLSSRVLPCFLSVFLSLFLAACGGGSGGGSPIPATQTNPNTVAQPGSQTVPKDTSPVVQTPVQNPPDPSPSAPTPAPTPVPAEPALNVVQRENAMTAGVSSDWQIADQNYASGREIEGYASATSVNRGESIRLYVNTVDPEYTISVYRIGWYGGKGGRLVAGPVRRSGVRQAAPFHDQETHLVECDWTDPYVLNIPNTPADPTNWASGIYLAKLAGSSGKQSYIIFAVRDDARNADLLFQSSVTTFAGYNNWGGHSVYGVRSEGGKAAHKVSFNRPYRIPEQPLDGKGAGDFLAWEIHLVRFLERHGYDVAYSTNIDTDRAPQQLQKHRAFLSVGHDEYWTKSMRDGMEAARDKGVNLAFFGANTGYWQVRLEADRNGQARRTMVAYKYDTQARDPMYKTNPPLSTYLWRESPINRPEAALVGIQYQYNSVDLDMLIANCPDWICAGTGLRSGSVLKGMLGYEVDAIVAASPSGVVKLAESPYSVCTDSACTQRETRYAHMSYYTAPSGAGVFATGSMNWHWGLDSYGPRGDRVNPAVQRITNNILTRFVSQ